MNRGLPACLDVVLGVAVDVRISSLLLIVNVLAIVNPFFASVG